MTVAALRREMSNREFVAWQVYYAREAQRDELRQKQTRQRR